jgi:phosphorylcholine metabolism protein LicD
MRYILVWVLLVCALGVAGMLVGIVLQHNYPLMNDKLKLDHYVLMDRFVRFAQQHNLKYFAVAGTLLGAIRHRAMIPWDNDIDIGMLPEDYQRLHDLQLELLASEMVFTPDPFLGKIWAKETGSKSTHSDACIDVFAMIHSEGIVRYKIESYVKEYPNDYLFPKEIETTKEYKYGPVTIQGPNVDIPAYCERTWGKNWIEPVVKTEFRLLYPLQTRKMQREWKKSERYAELRNAYAPFAA